MKPRSTSARGSRARTSAPRSRPGQCRIGGMKAPVVRAAAIVVAVVALSLPLHGRSQPRTPDFERQAQDQAETDRTWREASAGHMQLEKITYRSRVGDLDIPAYVFQPLT